MEMKKADFLENLFILKLFDGRGHHFQENKSENQKKKLTNKIEFKKYLKDKSYKNINFFAILNFLNKNEL